MKKTIHYPGRAGFAPERAVAVGGVLPAPEPIGYNEGRPVVRLAVRNTGDRPVQVGSHFHFFEVNRFLAFDRPAAFGCHLNIPATTAVRFEPGDERQVELVPYAGKRRVIGFNGLVMGYAGSPSADTPYLPTREQALRRMRQRGFLCLEAGPQEAGGARSQQAAEPAKGPAKRPAAGRSLRTAGAERLPVPPRPRGRRKRSEGAATGSETK